MKAVLLAGGQGTRLRPVTGEHPKPLVPLLGRPLMEHILLLLREHGFTQVCAALGYRAEEIMDCFGNGSRLGIRLEYRTDNGPLGTAGAVRRCADFIGGEDVLVISGDVACDLDLSALWQRHQESGAAASLALYRDPSPLRFGLAVTDEQDRIRAFVEKPRWSRVVSDLINAGIYVLSPRALKRISPDGPSDFARDLFPALLSEGESLLGVPLEGYWCDLGTPLSYYRCCVDALEGRLRLNLGEAFRQKQESEPEPAEEKADAVLDCACEDRAALMGKLSRLMLELDADLSDGIRLCRPGFRLHISPEESRSAIRVAASAEDAEFARSLAISAGEVVRALNA